MSDAWIPHDGKGMPVEPDTKVLVRTRNTNQGGPGRASNWGSQWTHGGGAADVVAYQVIPAEAPAPDSPQVISLQDIQQQIRGLIICAAMNHGIRINRAAATWREDGGGLTLCEVTFEMTSKR